MIIYYMLYACYYMYCICHFFRSYMILLHMNLSLAPFEVGLLTFSFLLSSGMFHASVAVLPSSTCMRHAYFNLFSHAFTCF